MDLGCLMTPQVSVRTFGVMYGHTVLKGMVQRGREGEGRERQRERGGREWI